jgi:predicted TIM-barrel fold metal-dependent hydrolase
MTATQNLLTYFPQMEKNIDKIVYGSDWPGIRTIGCNIDSIKRLPLSQESLEKLLCANAARILRL